MANDMNNFNKELEVLIDKYISAEVTEVHTNQNINSILEQAKKIAEKEGFSVSQLWLTFKTNLEKVKLVHPTSLADEKTLEELGYYDK